MKNELLESVEYLEYMFWLLNEMRATDLLNVDKNVFTQTEKILNFIEKIKSENR